MFDFSPGWHTTINPLWYFLGLVLSIRESDILIYLITIKVLRIQEAQSKVPLNTVNFVFCILTTVLIVPSLIALIIFWSHHLFSDELGLLSSSLILYLLLSWIPLLLVLLFWRKKNRVNVNLAIIIMIVYNLGIWIELIHKLVGL